MTKTEENLKAAFAGESQARNKYTFYAKTARNEGYHYIAKIFEATADNEMEHAKEEFKLLKQLGNTRENLNEAVNGEDYETKSMYPEFAKIAKEEGNMAAAVLFEQVAKVEKEHRERYKMLLKMVEEGTVYKRAQPIKWRCSKCGFVYEGTEPPVKCPLCKHEREYYEPFEL